MFSLIITIVAIALVTALALSTIYYGGTAFRNGKVAAEAAQLVNEGQQIIGAVDLYTANTPGGGWPADLQELVAKGYLSAVPAGHAQAPSFLIPTAYAGVDGWKTMLVSNPTYQLSAPVGDTLCREVNSRVLGTSGVPNQAYASAATQCYHSNSTGDNRIVVTRLGTALIAALPAGEAAAVDAPIPPADAEGVWFLTPLTVVDASGTGGAGGPGQTPAQTATLSAPSFPATQVGSGRTAVATLTNTGTGALTVTPSSESVTGDDFSLVSTTCGTSIAVADTCSITVQFAPAFGGSFDSTLSVVTGAGTKTVSLSGTGVQGSASVSATSLSYAAQQASTTSASQRVIVTNTGSTTLNFTGISVTSGTSDFAQSNDCESIAVNGTCHIDVSFTPSTAGAKTGTIAIGHNGGGVTRLDVSGMGQAPSASLSNPVFSTTQVGSSSTAVATLTNTGIGAFPMTVPTAASVTGSGYSFLSTTCGTSVAVAGTCTVTVLFAPQTSPATAGSLSIDNVASPISTALSGTGTPAPTGVAFLVPSLVVGTVSSGDTVAFTLVNHGTTSVQIDSAVLSDSSVVHAVGTTCTSGTVASASDVGAAIYATALKLLVPTANAIVVGPPAVDYSNFQNVPWALAAGASCTLTVSYEGANSGTPFSSGLTVQMKDGSSASASVSGTLGIALPIETLAAGGAVFTPWTYLERLYPEGIIYVNVTNTSPYTLATITSSIDNNWHYGRGIIVAGPSSNIVPGATVTVQMLLYPGSTNSYVEPAEIRFTAYGIGSSGAVVAQVLGVRVR